VVDREILVRQCMDLSAEPEARGVKPRTLFSVAYEQGLDVVFTRLAIESGVSPRIVFTGAVPEPDLCVRYAQCLAGRWLKFVALSVLLGSGKAPWDRQRETLRAFCESGEALFSYYAQGGLNDAALQAIVKTIVELTSGRERPARSSKVSFDIPSVKSDVTDMPFAPKSWSDLRAVLQTLTALKGAKAALAKEFGVSRQVVNAWLTTGAPSADTTIQLLNWTRGIEPQPKETASALRTPKRQKVQKPMKQTNAKHEKPNREKG